MDIVRLTSRLKAAEEEKAKQETVLCEVRIELKETKGWLKQSEEFLDKSNTKLLSFQEAQEEAANLVTMVYSKGQLELLQLRAVRLSRNDW